MFKVGQKVVCIKTFHGHSGVSVILNEIYIVDSFENSAWGLGMRVSDKNGNKNGWWIKYNELFRHLDETFATEVLEQIKEQIEQEQLVLI